MEDGAGSKDAEEDDDDDEEDPADLLTALLDEVSPPETSDDTAGQPESDPPQRPAATTDVDGEVEILSDEPRPRVAWPSPVDLEEEPEAGAGGDGRQSRYRSHSAQLPRLGRQAKSNMTTMANLRKKSRGIDKDD